jgi:hypothetical protein
MWIGDRCNLTGVGDRCNLTGVVTSVEVFRTIPTYTFVTLNEKFWVIICCRPGYARELSVSKWQGH